MKLVVVSHKVCWNSPDSLDVYSTDGGFPLQIKAISELFDETRVVVPCETAAGTEGISPLVGNHISVLPLSVPNGTDLRRKLNIPYWLLKNGRLIWREVRGADAVHAPIPGDVGTIGMLFALILRKRLFVRHCGNWLIPRTAAEHFWKWTMERFAGGRNVMLATGGTADLPSAKNPQVKWIFSTSLRRSQLAAGSPRRLAANGKIKLLIACRQEEGKGTDTVIKSLPMILRKFPSASLDIVGGGSFMSALKDLSERLGLGSKVVFHGKVEQAKVVELMKQAHVFCFPTQASEGFPKVVLEALACGLPVVTTKVSVLPQLISKDCGVLLDEPTEECVAAAVEAVCSDAEKYERMSAAAVATAQDYSLESWRDSIGETLRRSWKVSSLSSAPEPTSVL